MMILLFHIVSVIKMLYALMKNCFLITSSAYSLCGLIHLFVTLLSVVSELVNRSFVGNESAKLLEVWKNKHDLGRNKRLLVAVEL